MGLYMKFNQSLALITSLALSSSCMQKPELKEDPVVPVEAAQVQQSLISAWGNVEPTSMVKDDYIAIDSSIKGYGQAAQVQLQIATQIMNKTAVDNTYVFDFAQRAVIYSTDPVCDFVNTFRRVADVPSVSNVNSVAIKHWHKPLAEQFALNSQIMKSNDETISSQCDDIAKKFYYPMSFEIVQFALGLCSDTQEYRVDCYNLKIKTETRVSPDRLNSKKIATQTIIFDQVAAPIQQTEKNSAEESKVTYEITLSQEAPFLARVLEFCRKGIVSAANGQKTLATICDSVKSFQHPTTPIQ